MPVSFPTIPSTGLLVPLFYAEMDNSQASYFENNRRALLVGLRLSTGTVAADVLTQVTRADQAKTYFGVGSQLARMVEAYKANNSFGELWCVAADEDGAGAAATGTLTITGTATANGTLNIYIAGQRVLAAVAIGDTATVVGDALETAVNADTDLPVTASNTTGTVTFTARHKGEYGNDIDLRANYLGLLGSEQTPAGLSLAFVAMASGTTNPDITTALAALGDEDFEYIGVGFDDATNLTALDTELNDTTGRWGYVRQLHGHAFAASVGTQSALTTLGNSRNGQHVSILGYYDSPTPPWEAASMLVGQVQAAANTDPARPFQTLALLGFHNPPEASRFTLSERNILLSDGISTLQYASTLARLDRVVTTYQLNAFAQPDPSYRDANTLFTSAYVLRFLRQRITQKWPRHKLADDGTRFGPGQAIVTPRIVKAELLAAYSHLEFIGLVENAALFEQNLVVERNVGDPNRIDVLLPPDYVNQLRVFALLNQFRLQYPATQAAA